VASVQIKSNTVTLTLQGNTLVNDGQLHHLALTFVSGGAVGLYVDGRLQASGTAPAFTFNPNPLRFGSLLDGFWTPLRGLLDEVQIFNRVLSAGEIQGIFNAGSAGQVKGVTVLDPPVTATGGFTFTAVAGVSSPLQTVATFTDPAGAEALADYSAVIDWGDGSTSPADQVSLNATTGVFTVQGSHLYSQSGSNTITVTIHHDAASDVTATSTAQVSPLVVHFLVAGFPSPTTAGAAGSLMVTALDQLGDLVSGYRGSVHFTSSDAQALLPPDYSFTADDNGQHVFSVTLQTAGPQSVTVTDTQTASFTGTQADIVVNPAAAVGLIFSGPAGPVVAGTLFTFTVTAVDPFGNVDMNYGGQVHFGSSDDQAMLPADYLFTAGDMGTQTFTAVLFTPGTQSLSALDLLTAIDGREDGIQVVKG
jgi:hypothetical protein